MESSMVCVNHTHWSTELHGNGVYLLLQYTHMLHFLLFLVSDFMPLHMTAFKSLHL